MRAPSPRPEKTLADTLAMAVGPVLLIVLLGSLMLFLVEVGYRGPHAPQVRWTLTWFILATVLVSRISIERGSSYGSLYGLALGLATAFRLTQFLGVHLGALLLLGILWWCASKLTWDCTVIDEDTDASGEGLLQLAGLDRSQPDSRSEPELEPGPAGAPPPTVGVPDGPAKGRSATQPPHAPGLWVVYFSLGALPLFGLGQLALPAEAEAARFRAFLFLWTYLAAALGLLLITSFLGLRRYLRQRHLVMPPLVVRSWMVVGSALTLIVLFGSLWLPRPEGADTLANLLTRIRPSPSQTAPHAWSSGDAAERGGQPGEERPEFDSDPTRGERKPTDSMDQSRKPDTDSARPAEDPTPPGRSPGEEPVGESPPTRSGQTPSREVAAPQVEWISWLRWFMLAIGIVALLVLLVQFGPRWIQALRESRTRRAATRARPPAERERRVRSFASYVNPFLTGRVHEMSERELTAYTFDALQAWARERGWGRPPEQTPVEFGHALARHIPDRSWEVLGTVRLYVRIAYGAGAATPGSVEVLERLWNGLLAVPDMAR
jgi:phosphatidylglycerophosphate synthase